MINGQSSQLALLRLMQIVSQGSPTGAFSYSQGLEWAVDAGWVHDAATFELWVQEQLMGTLAQQELPLMLRFYRAFEAGVFEASAFEASAFEVSAFEARALEPSGAVASGGEPGALDGSAPEPNVTGSGSNTISAIETSAADINSEDVQTRHASALRAAGSRRVAQLAATVLSLRETSELRDEERKRGQAMARLVTQLNRKIECHVGEGGNADHCQLGVFTEYCVAEHIPVLLAMHGYAFAWLESQVTAGIKLVPLGQTNGQQVLYRLAEKIDQCVVHAQTVLDDDIGYSSPALAMASSLHETQYSRLFRS